MTAREAKRINRRAAAVTFLAAVNAVALILTVIFWLVVWLKRWIPSPGSLTAMTERANAATTYGFMAGDLIWSAPLLLLAALGLWRRRFWGWTAAQMANVLWIYSMTVIWVRDGYSTVSPGAVLFTPFAVIAFWAIGVLWRHRSLFREQ